MLTMSSTYTTLNDKRGSPNTTTLGSRESLIPELGSTPSSILISMISNSLVIISNCQLSQASIARIHELDDSVELEMSTLASSTLPQNLSSSFVTKYTHTRTPPNFYYFQKLFQQQQQGSILHACGPFSFSGPAPALSLPHELRVLCCHFVSCCSRHRAPFTVKYHLPRLEFFGDYTAWKIASYAHMYVFTN